MNLFVSFLVALAFVSGIHESSRVNATVIDNFRKQPRKLSTPTECARECKKGEKPKTCYYHFTVEHFASLTRACDLCRSNSTTNLESDCQCITYDGYETSSLITANRMYPGPAMMVCIDDYVVVDVVNHVPANGITIHWHGIFQKGYQYYDGVPYVTQCPIHEGATFRYQWRADNPGTHFWHSHVGLQKVAGLAGPLIVRQPKYSEPNRRLWDHDNLDNVIMITDTMHDSAENHFPGTKSPTIGPLPHSFLINGLGQWTDPATGITTSSPLAEFRVKAGKRYRFRLINSCGFICPVQFTIEGHNLTVIATDGIPIKPVLATSITSSSAERFDFIIDAKEHPSQYWIQLRGLSACASLKLQQLAVLSYESALERSNLTKPSYDVGIDAGVIFNPLNVRCDRSSKDKFVCIEQLESLGKVPGEITKEEPDMRMHLPFGFHAYSTEEIFKPGTYNRFLVSTRQIAGIVDKISNTLPPSPYLSQRENIPEEKICSKGKLPSECESPDFCSCAHIVKIPLNSVMEIILIDEAHANGISHPFHLHGHVFYIVGEGHGEDYNITSISLNHVLELDRHGMIQRNLKKPLAKDTYAVPNNGYSIIRFHATNPGYWLFHCHFVYHLEVGMSLVFQVGEQSDMPKVPEGFPRCENFVPPINDRS